MAALTWNKETKWSLLSSCGLWRIGKAMVNGAPVYTLARLGSKHPVLVCAGTLDACKAAAL
jgi:hypothetical protein